MEICSTRSGCRNVSSRITGRGRTVCTMLGLGDKAWLVFQEMLRTLLETLLIWFVGEARTSFPIKLEIFFMSNTQLLNMIQTSEKEDNIIDDTLLINRQRHCP